MAEEIAVVSRINHAEGTIDAWDVNTGVIEGVPYDGFPPAPLSTVRLTEPPMRRVDRQIGPYRQLFYDDFTNASQTLVAYSERTSSSGNVSAETADINATTFLRSGQRYRIECQYRWDATASNGGIRVRVRDGAGTGGTLLALSEMFTGSVSVPESNHLTGYIVGDGASHTIQLTLERYVSGGSVQFIAGTGSPVWIAVYEDGPTEVGDTSWLVETSTPGPGGGASGVNYVRSATLDDAVGVVELYDVLSGEDLYIRKAQNFMVPPSDRAWWLSTRVQLDEDCTNIVCGFGSSNGGGLEYLTALALASASTVYLESRLSATIASVDSGTPFATEEWQILDIVLIAGLFGALWVNGDGPWVINDATRLPAEAADMYPFVGTIGEGGAAPVFIDWCHCQEFSQVSDPTAFSVSGVEQNF